MEGALSLPFSSLRFSRLCFSHLCFSPPSVSLLLLFLLLFLFLSRPIFISPSQLSIYLSFTASIPIPIFFSVALEFLLLTFVFHSRCM